MFKSLLLNYDYQPLRFLSERRSIVLYLKEDKVDVLEFWNDKVTTVNGHIKYPAVMRLKNYVKFVKSNYKFTRDALFKRDSYHCKYCNIPLNNKTATIDHIIPKSKGGKTDWLNCVTSCKDCNSWKMDLTLEEAKMKLKSKPFVPPFSLKTELDYIGIKHSSWMNYIA